MSGRHAREIQALAAAEAVARWTAIPHPYPLDDGLAFVERAQRLRARGMRETFAVCEADRLLGVATLARREATPDHAELGYWIGRPYWGRRYAPAAGRQLLAHGFGRMRLSLVFARCFGANHASIRVLEKLGFRFVGLEADELETAGAPVRADPRNGVVGHQVAGVDKGTDKFWYVCLPDTVDPRDPKGR